MKKFIFLLLIFLLAVSASPVFAQSYGASRYNPYNPYSPPEQKAALERVPYESIYSTNPYGTVVPTTDTRYYLYERDYLTRPYVTEFRRGFYQEDYYNNPYGTIPRHWYDTQLGTTGGGSGRGYEVSGMLTSPYEDTYLRQKQSAMMENPNQGRASLDSEYTTIPYGADPRRWYDTPTTAQGAPSKSLEGPKNVWGSHSTADAQNQTSSELTSPFEKNSHPLSVRMETKGEMSPTTQELTPPALP